jgi:hypothetical protein
MCFCYWRLVITGLVVACNKFVASVMESMKIRNKAQSPVSTTPATIYAGNNNIGNNILPLSVTLQ